jgi:hypothetical protein
MASANTKRKNELKLGLLLNLGTFDSHALDIGVILGSTIALFAISAWLHRRQSAVAAVI